MNFIAAQQFKKHLESHTAGKHQYYNHFTITMPLGPEMIPIPILQILSFCNGRVDVFCKSSCFVVWQFPWVPIGPISVIFALSKICQPYNSAYHAFGRIFLSSNQKNIRTGKIYSNLSICLLVQIFKRANREKSWDFYLFNTSLPFQFVLLLNIDKMLFSMTHFYLCFYGMNVECNITRQNIIYMLQNIYVIHAYLSVHKFRIWYICIWGEI